MKNTNKKGFTLVELLVVIAILAILATVAVVGYTSFTKKAEISADQQAVVQMNKVLEADKTLNGVPADVDAVKTLLIANDYNGALTTYYSGYQLAWLKADNVIVLVEKDAIVYPEDYAGKTGYELLTRLATDAGSLTNGLKNDQILHVNANINANDDFAPEASGEYVVNLNGNTINSSDYVGSWVADGKLVVSNGTIDGTDTENRVVVYANYDGAVELNNVQVYAPAGTNPIQAYGGKMVLNNVTVAQSGNNELGYYNAAIQVVNGYGENANYKAHLTVDGGVYTGKKAIQMSSPGGTIVINDGIFTGSEYVIHMDGGVSSGYVNVEHSLTINGGTFNGDIRINNTSLEGFTIVLNGGTFNGNIVDRNGNVLDVNQFLGEGKTIVNNADGTWTVQ